MAGETPAVPTLPAEVSLLARRSVAYASVDCWRTNRSRDARAAVRAVWARRACRDTTIHDRNALAATPASIRDNCAIEMTSSANPIAVNTRSIMPSHLLREIGPCDRRAARISADFRGKADGLKIVSRSR